MHLALVRKVSQFFCREGEILERIMYNMYSSDSYLLQTKEERVGFSFLKKGALLYPRNVLSNTDLEILLKCSFF